MAKKFHTYNQLDIFCHFDFCHDKRNGFRVIFQPQFMVEKFMVQEFMVEMSVVYVSWVWGWKVRDWNAQQPLRDSQTNIKSQSWAFPLLIKICFLNWKWALWLFSINSFIPFLIPVKDLSMSILVSNILASIVPVLAFINFDPEEPCFGDVVKK